VDIIDCFGERQRSDRTDSKFPLKPSRALKKMRKAEPSVAMNYLWPGYHVPIRCSHDVA
jgi:hypothetical protein